MSPVLARDCSNYTVELGDELLARWRAEGVRLCIVQALTPPPGKPHAGDGGWCASQGRRLLEGGFVVDAYLFWRDGLAQTFAERIALMDSVSVRQWWVDLETTEGVNLAGSALTGSVQSALQTADTAPGWLGRRAGWYTSQRWINWFVASGGDLAVLDGRPRWMVNWNGVADASDTHYGGQPVEIKQLAGTQPDGTDMNVLSEAEAMRLDRQPTPAFTVDELQQALSYLAVKVMQPLRSYRYAKIRRAVAEVERVARQYEALS